MQIFLHLNGENVGPFTLPRVSAKLVSGEVPPETLAWRDGLDNWYPLHHEIWEEVGIKTQVAPERPAPLEEEPVSEKVSDLAPSDSGRSLQGEDGVESDSESDGEQDDLETAPPSDPEQVSAQDVEAEVTSEEPGSAFANYSEEDFKPPTIEEMDREMSDLRVRRDPLVEQIGEKAFDADFQDEEIEDAKVAVANAQKNGDQDALRKANEKLGQAVLEAGLHDDSIEELRTQHRELSDRMLNLQMQARRMGGVSKDKPKGWMKWIFILFVLCLIGGVVTLAFLFRQ